LNQQTFEYIVAGAAVVITLSFLIQAAMMIGVYSSVKKLNKTAELLQARAVPIINKMEPVVLQVQTTVNTVGATIDKISSQALDTFDKVAVEARAISAAVSIVTRRGLFSQKMNPSKSAPALTAACASATFVIPQILTLTAISRPTFHVPHPATTLFTRRQH